MSVIDAIIQGIIQGLTDFLPVSSSGHLTVYQHVTGSGGNSEALLFSVLLHIGTLLAVAIVYYKLIGKLIVELFRLIGDLFTLRFSWKNMNSERRMLIMMILSVAMLVPLVLPIFGGQSLQDLMEPITEGGNIIIVGCCFLLTSALLLTAYFLSKRKDGRHPDATVKDALWIGAAQDVAALLPGVSRSGSTIATGLICGLERSYMVQYTFIMSVPTILAANVLLAGKEAIESGNTAIELLPTLAGVITAAVVGVLSIKMIDWIIRKDRYNWFGYYCAVMGIAVIALGIWEQSSGTTLATLLGR